MSLLNLITKFDNLKSAIDKQTDEAAKDLAKELLTNTLELKDVQKLFKDLPEDLSMQILMKAASIISKSTSTTSSPEHSTSRRSNRNLFS